jgi:hypothetical protein
MLFTRTVYDRGSRYRLRPVLHDRLRLDTASPMVRAVASLLSMVTSPPLHTLAAPSLLSRPPVQSLPTVPLQLATRDGPLQRGDSKRRPWRRCSFAGREMAGRQSWHRAATSGTRNALESMPFLLLTDDRLSRLASLHHACSHLLPVSRTCPEA